MSIEDLFESSPSSVWAIVKLESLQLFHRHHIYATDERNVSQTSELTETLTVGR